MSAATYQQNRGGYGGGGNMQSWQAADKQLVQAELEPGELLERVVILGDLKPLSPQQRVIYYNEVCRSVGLNPLTRPFIYLELDGRLQLYATRSCADQLRQNNAISSQIVSEGRDPDDATLYKAIVRVSNSKGRTGEDIAYLCIENMTGKDLANAKMKAITKAIRRATLGFCGIGLPLEDDAQEPPRALDEEALRADDSRRRLLGVPVESQGAAKPGPRANRAVLEEVNKVARALWGDRADVEMQKFRADNPHIRSAEAALKALREEEQKRNGQGADVIEGSFEDQSVPSRDDIAEQARMAMQAEQADMDEVFEGEDGDEGGES